MVFSILMMSSILFTSFVPQKTQALEKEKISRFLNTCLYGAATGALLGIASLAFVSDPAGSMNNIARGASLGLYAGIGVGFYVMDHTVLDVHLQPAAPATMAGAGSGHYFVRYVR